jgi:flagellar biosynthetic protein FlhB
MAMGAHGERTEKPTSRRLEEARKRGQVARSADLGRTATLGAAILAFAWAGGDFIARLAALALQGLERAAHVAGRSIGPEELSSLAASHAWAMAAIVGPVALAASVGTLAAFTAQGGWMFSPQAITFDLGRLSPMQGLRRLAPSRAGLDLVKAALAASAVAVVAVNVIETAILDADRLARLTPAVAGAALWDHAMRLLKGAFVVMVAFAAADYGLQRRRFMSSLRMTKQEVRDDVKMTEGNPEIKARIRRLQREMLRRRMLTATRKATVVVVNPTHYAVALEYRRGMAAPRCVAKGVDLMAARIRAVAREHGVPIVENRSLAQALYRAVEIGESIPGALFEAVAEVLAYLVRIRQLAL